MIALPSHRLSTRRLYLQQSWRESSVSNGGVLTHSHHPQGSLPVPQTIPLIDMRISIHLMFVGANDTVDTAGVVGKRVSDIRALLQEKLK